MQWNVYLPIITVLSHRSFHEYVLNVETQGSVKGKEQMYEQNQDDDAPPGTFLIIAVMSLQSLTFYSESDKRRRLKTSSDAALRSIRRDRKVWLNALTSKRGRNGAI